MSSSIRSRAGSFLIGSFPFVPSAIYLFANSLEAPLIGLADARQNRAIIQFRVLAIAPTKLIRPLIRSFKFQH